MKAIEEILKEIENGGIESIGMNKKTLDIIEEALGKKRMKEFDIVVTPCGIISLFKKEEKEEEVLEVGDRVESIIEDGVIKKGDKGTVRDNEEGSNFTVIKLDEEIDGVSLWSINKKEVHECVKKIEKEKELNKKIIRTVADLDVVQREGSKEVSFWYEDINFKFERRELEKVVDCLNALGGNFEYNPVEVIDTLEKLDNFLMKTYDNGVYYRKKENQWIVPGNKYVEYSDIKDIEKIYNVDLQILKK